MKIALVSWPRPSSPQDTSPGAAIVNETFARDLFPRPGSHRTAHLCARRQSPPQQDRRRHPRHPPVTTTCASPTAPSSTYRSPESTANPTPRLKPSPPSPFTPKPRTRLPLADSSGGLHRAAQQRSSRLEHHHQLDLVRLTSTIRERLIATLAAFFAAVALLLAGIGLYGGPSTSRSSSAAARSVSAMAIGSSSCWHRAYCDSWDVFVMIALGGCARLPTRIRRGALCL